MLSKIADGISVKLNSAFGDGYEIYTEDVEQGLEEPCFFIKSLTVVNTPLLGKRKKRAYPFDISYFPLNGNDEMMSVSETAMEELEYITLLDGDTLRASQITSEIVDGVLHIDVTYTLILNDYSHEEEMDTVDVKMGVEG